MELWKRAEADEKNEVTKDWIQSRQDEPNNVRSSYSQVEENHAAHYADKIENSTRCADVIELIFKELLSPMKKIQSLD